MYQSSIKIPSLTFFITAFLLVLLSSCDHQTSERVFWSPYQDLNWENIGHYDSEFHTHPGLGDEQYDPHQTIDRYHSEGYSILTLAAHDYDVPSDYINTIYPWTELSLIYEIIKDVENPTEDDKTYGEMANEPFQNRDPIALNMVSVEGCEVSAPHHIVSLFNPLSQGLETEEETFQKIQDLGGIAYFAHPGRYIERWGLDANWYVEKYLQFECMIGQSIYNRRDNHPGDRKFFDEVVHILGSERPIWLFGEDDMHREITLGWNRDVILLENFQPGSMHPDIQNGSAPDVKEALIKGYTYLWKPAEQYNRRAFNIVNFEVKSESLMVTVDLPDEVQEVRWITYNPESKDSEFIEGTFELDMENVPAYSHFVRAEITGEKGTIYTQPIYVVRNK